MFAVWVDRMDGEKVEEFIDWVDNGDGDGKPEPVEKTAFLMEFDGEIG